MVDYENLETNPLKLRLNYGGDGLIQSLVMEVLVSSYGELVSLVCKMDEIDELESSYLQSELIELIELINESNQNSFRYGNFLITQLEC